MATAYRQYLGIPQWAATSFAKAVIARREGGKVLREILPLLAASLGADPGESLHLDHNPALRTRPYNPRVKNVAARYTPNANDPEYLIYRTQHAHHIKTNVRGDGAQHPDRVLIKRERKRERAAAPCARCCMRARVTGSRLCKRCGKVAVKHHRKIQSANRWPPKGSRKIQNRKRPCR